MKWLNIWAHVWTCWSLDTDNFVVCFADHQSYQRHRFFSGILKSLLFCLHTHGSIVVKTQRIIFPHHKSHEAETKPNEFSIYWEINISPCFQVDFSLYIMICNWAMHIYIPGRLTGNFAFGKKEWYHDWLNKFRNQF